MEALIEVVLSVIPHATRERAKADLQITRSAEDTISRILDNQDELTTRVSLDVARAIDSEQRATHGSFSPFDGFSEEQDDNIVSIVDGGGFRSTEARSDTLNSELSGHFSLRPVPPRPQPSRSEPVLNVTISDTEQEHIEDSELELSHHMLESQSPLLSEISLSPHFKHEDLDKVREQTFRLARSYCSHPEKALPFLQLLSFSKRRADPFVVSTCLGEKMRLMERDLSYLRGVFNDSRLLESILDAGGTVFALSVQEQAVMAFQNMRAQEASTHQPASYRERSMVVPDALMDCCEVATRHGSDDSLYIIRNLLLVLFDGDMYLQIDNARLFGGRLRKVFRECHGNVICVLEGLEEAVRKSLTQAGQKRRRKEGLSEPLDLRQVRETIWDGDVANDNIHIRLSPTSTASAEILFRSVLENVKWMLSKGVPTAAAYLSSVGQDPKYASHMRSAELQHVLRSDQVPYVRMLLQIPGVSYGIALAIMKSYPTLSQLYCMARQHGAKELEVLNRWNERNLETNRKIGPKVAARITAVITSTDPNAPADQDIG